MLKRHVAVRFYVGGKRRLSLSVNDSFFGVNIDSCFELPLRTDERKGHFMYLLIISGYELGQFLRIMLWICTPAVVLLMLVTTWIHYRRRQKLSLSFLLSVEGFAPGDPGHMTAGGRVDEERSVSEGEDDYKENLYKGILWMKEKYEQYRDLADERYERLKDQLNQVEKRYEDLLESVQQTHSGAASSSPAIVMDEQGIMDTVVRHDEPVPLAIIPEEARPEEFSGQTEVVVERAEAGPGRLRLQELEEQLARTQQRFDEEVGRLRYQLDEEIARARRLQDERNAFVDTCRQLEQQVLHSGRQLEEKQRIIADLEGQLTTDRMKIDELVAKLRNNSQLLMNIYQELDKSLHFSDGAVQG